MSKRLYSFSHNLLEWQRRAGRHHLPWQNTDIYGIWISEIMLQQTQVSTVIEYYQRFIQRFPDVQTLANATIEEVLSYWAGLGYYSRARNLHYASIQIMQDFQGEFPRNRQEWQSLKGVGRSTAAAICVFAFRQFECILDGNVKRVLCRYFAVTGSPNHKSTEEKLWQLSEQLLPDNQKDMPDYTQGLMDLGAMVCTRSKPHCLLCPLEQDCMAHQQGKTTQFPEKNTKPIVKKQIMFWVVLTNGVELVLEKRPSRGIWGGLWCVPCFDEEEKMQDFCRTIQNDNIEYQTEQIQHRLTHRQLNIQVKIIRLPENRWLSINIDNHRYHFTNLNNINKMGLPKPLSELVGRLFAVSPKVSPHKPREGKHGK